MSDQPINPLEEAPWCEMCGVTLTHDELNLCAKRHKYGDIQEQLCLKCYDWWEKQFVAIKLSDGIGKLKL